MYTPDPKDAQQQREQAQHVIEKIARRYTSLKYRVRELEWYRTMFQSCGSWQDALDVLEEQMVLWGRPVQQKNAHLVESYTASLKAHVIARRQDGWNQEEYAVFAKARALSEARYALRFLPTEQALFFLLQKRRTILECLDDPMCSPPEASRLNAIARELEAIIHDIEEKCGISSEEECSPQDTSDFP